jgi:diguanylate cyclase (GGDEF)-like protein/PAS domain S-box-containing protein
LLRNPQLLKAAIALLIAGVAGVDLLLPVHTAVGALYAIPILFSLWVGKRRFTLLIAAACLSLELSTIFAHDPGDSWRPVVASRGATLLSIAVATSLGLMRLHAESELGYVRKWALTTLRCLGDAVITLNNDDEVRFVNRAAERLLGRPRDELEGRKASDVFLARDVDAPRPPVEELAERGWSDVREAVLFTLGGQRIPIEYSRTVIEGADGARFGSVIVFRDISARKESEDAIKRLAYRDELTGLPNRNSLGDRLHLELAHAKRNREPLALAYLDLDGFKAINDARGHAAGDELPRTVARRMSSTLRAGDTVARIGGDEFVLLLPSISGADEARRVAEKIVAAVEQPVTWNDQPMRASASIGIALYPRDGEEPESLLRRADKAMYRAKSKGRGRVELVIWSDAPAL